MKGYVSSLLPRIEANYHNFTNLEKTIADFFLNNTEKTDFSAKAISGKLFVSEASLSRFAKKIGYRGYREFIYEYKETFMMCGNEDQTTNDVLDTYQELLVKAYNLIDKAHGFGSSGLVATEFKNRFMRFGLDVEAIVDYHTMLMNSVRVNENCLVIGISLSGATKEVIDALEQAAMKNAKTVLLTSRNDKEFQRMFDEVVLSAVKKNLEYGDMISPQFPLLILIDRIYADYVQREDERKKTLYDKTVKQIVGRYIEFDEKERG